jgi:PhoH-like ATPase
MNQLDPLHDTSTLASLSPSADLQTPAPRKKKTRPKPNGAGKHFILDTNVLLHDPTCLGRFEDNHVHIPVDVLSELDRFKNEQSERGANARKVHRTLTEMFSKNGASVLNGVPTPGGGTVRLAVFDLGGANKVPLAKFHRIFPDLERVDHRILANVILLQAEIKTRAILVTKDLNMALKARAVGLQCQDYLNDKVEAKDVESYDLRLIEVSPHELQRFASSGELALSGDRTAALLLNEYVLLTSGEKKTMPARFVRERVFRRLAIPETLHIPRGIDLRPANLGQQCFIDALLDPTLSLVTCYGQAGTGKTLLAVAAGLHQVFGKSFNGLTVSRPIVAMGETLGFLPGTLEEKMRPWLQPIYDAFDVLMPPAVVTVSENKKKRKHPGAPAPAAPHANGPSGLAARKPYEYLLEQGIVEIEALAYIRGRSIPRRIFILDEAQQLTPLEAKTVVTRMSRGSKLVLVGDPAQIDNPYVDSRSNGLVYTRNRLKGEAIAAHVSLNKGERSALAEIGARLM